jgi:hypothetical protein
MPFKKLMYFMLGMVKESTQNALERFFPKIKEATHMSQQVFSHARQKVKWEAFRELFQVDARLEPLGVDERILAKEHLEALTNLRLGLGERKVIAIFDRGYPSKDFIKYLQDKGITYVMRVRIFTR